LSDDPWDTIEDRFPPGKVVDGEVTKTKKYGAFLQIADGVEGLLHISELSWDHVERTEDILKVGEQVKVMVLSADRARRRISLSLRQLHGGGPEGPAEYVPPSYDLGEDGDASTDRAALVARSDAELDESLAESALPEVEAEAVLDEASGEPETAAEPAKSAGETVAEADAVMVEAEAVLEEALVVAEAVLEEARAEADAQPEGEVEVAPGADAEPEVDVAVAPDLAGEPVTEADPVGTEPGVEG
jgi:hypothetical protein